MHAKQSKHTQFKASRFQHLTHEQGGAHRATTSPVEEWGIPNPPGISVAPAGMAQVRQCQAMVQETKTELMALKVGRVMRQSQLSKLQGRIKNITANVLKQETHVPKKRPTDSGSMVSEHGTPDSETGYAYIE